VQRRPVEQHGGTRVFFQIPGLRAAVVREEHEPPPIEATQDDEAGGRLASGGGGGHDHRIGVVARHRDPRVCPPSLESIERVGVGSRRVEALGRVGRGEIVGHDGARYTLCGA
jgi:hypothetical protein